MPELLRQRRLWAVALGEEGGSTPCSLKAPQQRGQNWVFCACGEKVMARVRERRL